MNEKDVKHVKAIDITPYRFDVVCTIGDNPERVGVLVVHRAWNKDGTHIILGLDTHNAIFAKPDELLPVIGGDYSEHMPQDLIDKVEKRNAEFLSQRPAPYASCCSGRGYAHPQDYDPFKD